MMSIWFAAKNNNAQKVRELLQFDVNKKSSSYGHTALHYACINYNVEIADILLEKDSTDCNIQNDSGDTPLLILCRNIKTCRDSLLDSYKITDPQFVEQTWEDINNCYKIINLLFAKPNRVATNRQNTEGDNAIHYACRNKLEDLVLLLLKLSPTLKGDINNNCNEKTGQNMYMIAVDEKLKKVLNELYRLNTESNNSLITTWYNNKTGKNYNMITELQ